MSLKNRDVFAKDPGKNELVNNGVAQVADVRSAEQLQTLRYELETFVCDGQYGRGLERILSSYLTNRTKPEQPAVWVSGFYGSGKSHLVKMLRHLWADFEFPDDKAKARGITRLSQEIKDQLAELSTVGKGQGGLHAAAGTLGSGAGDSVRLALLGIVFRSAGLPEDYPTARFVMWLKHAGLLSKVESHIKKAGKSFEAELKHLYVSPLIAQALRAADPEFAKSDADARAILKAQYPPREDVTTREMNDAIKDAISQNGKFPCTLIVLDEVQQYIGDNSQRAFNVQEVAETCSKSFGGQLMFVGTGQTALTGTPQLQRLRDRFRIALELSDADVETVIRQIVLLKKPDKEQQLRKVLEEGSGEIARQLQGTKLEARREDDDYLAADYPLLPVRRRFWERTLRAVDRAGTAGQLRTQLKIVHEAARASADKPLGTVVPGDFVFDQIATDLTQTGVLLREIDEKIRKLRNGTPQGILKSRLCAMAFLIGKLPREAGADDGVRATADVLADLLVEDLAAGGAALRKQVPELLAELVEDRHLMQVDDEYRLQTRESAEWERDFGDRLVKLLHNDRELADERANLMRAECGDYLSDVRISQGKSKVARKIDVSFSAEKPPIDGPAIPVWIRDGWNDEEKAVLTDCRADSTDTPLVYVFIPRRSAEEFKKAIAACKAAEDTLNIRGTPVSPEGQEARRAMETRWNDAKSKRTTILEDIFKSAKVFLAGGAEKTGFVLSAIVEDAAKDALVRLFPHFHLADDARWGTVIERVRKGDGNALESVGYSGDVEKHAVCSAVLAHIGAGKKGREIRKHFVGSPYGWSQDAVDAALMVLVTSGHLAAKQDGRPLPGAQVDQTKIGVADFRVESATVTTPQRIALRKLFQDAGVPCKANEESAAAMRFIDELLKRGQAAGGEPPAPAPPNLAELKDLQQSSGNEQLVALYNARDALLQQATDWQSKAKQIEQRLPRWRVLQSLLRHAAHLEVAAEIAVQSQAIVDNCSLLKDPDPIPPLCDQLCQALRAALVEAHGQFKAEHSEQMKRLAAAEDWKKINEEQRQSILASRKLTAIPAIAVGTEQELLGSLNHQPLDNWTSQRDALPERFNQALHDAATLLEPKVQRIRLPSATLKSEQDVDDWLSVVRDKIVSYLHDGPVVV